MAAAVADYRPEVRSEGKIKKDGQPPEPLRLVENPDILAGLAAQRERGGRGRRPVLVGFAAETDTAEQAARAKLARKGCDLLVVNPVGNGLGFGTPDNEAVVLRHRRDGHADTARAQGSPRQCGVGLGGCQPTVSAGRQMSSNRRKSETSRWAPAAPLQSPLLPGVLGGGTTWRVACLLLSR